MSELRVLLAEDHQVVRQGLRALLRDVKDIDVVGEAEDGAAVVRLAAEIRPDVVVMDVGLDGLSGIEATRQLKRAESSVEVVILSMHDDAATVDAALRAGARAYVLKGRGIDSLCDAVRTVARGGMYLSPGVSDFVLQGYLSGERGAHDPLSDREREVLRLIGQGCTSREVADRLGLRTKTVQNYRTQIMDKLGVTTTAGLVRYAIRAGLCR